MHYADEYLENQVLTAPPHQLHLMVVDGAIRHLKEGIQSLKEKNYERVFLSLGQTRDFVNELLHGLKESEQTDVNQKMAQLFGFVHRMIVKADVEHQAEPACDALRILEMHRQTWMELINQLVTQETPPPTSTAKPVDTDLSPPTLLDFST